MILLDTHAVIWLAENPQKLSVSARRAIEEARQLEGLAISCQTLWEVALLVSRGRIRVKTPLRDFLQAIERNFTVIPITGAIAERASKLSEDYPKDPADHLIGATAIELGMALVTRDQAISCSGDVQCIW